MSEEFKSPILVTGTLVPSGTQDVNVISPIPLPVTGTLTPSGTYDVNIVSSITLSTLITNSSLAVTGPLTNTELRATPVPVSVSTSVLVTQGTSPWIVDGSGSVQPISGTVAVSNFPPIQPVSGTITALQGTTPWITDGSGTVQPVSGTVTANIGTTGGLALNSTLTSAAQKTQITDSLGNAVTIQQVGTSLVGTDIGLTTSSVIYGLTTGGGGGYVEVKVTPSGALTADVSGSSVSVTNFPAVQPISGTVTANQGTSPWVVSGTITTSPNVNVHDGTGVSISSTGSSLNVDVTNTIPVTGPLTDTQLRATPVPVTIPTPVPVTGTFFQTTQPVSGVGNFTVVQPTGTNLHTVLDSGTLTGALPAGTNVIGHVIADSGSTTVVTGNVTVIQPTGTNLHTTVDNFPATQPISGTVAVSNFPATQAVTQSTSPWIVSLASTTITGTVTVVQPTGTNLHTVLDSGTLTSITNALPTGSNVIGHVIADSGSTTVVTGNVTVVQPTGTNLHVVVDSAPSTVVTQGTSPWVISGTVTANAGTNLNTSALALDTTLALVLTTSAFQARINTLGQKTMANSTPVVLASDQSAIPVTQSTSPWVVSGTVTSNQGTANTAANGWPVKITDGTDIAIVDTDGSLFVKPVPVGTHANAWNAAAVASGGNSAVIDCQYVRTITIFGNVSANLNPLRIQASQDNTNFFTVTTISATTGNFGTTLDWGARYMRLQSGAGGTVTVTATIAGK